MGAGEFRMSLKEKITRIPEVFSMGTYSSVQIDDLEPMVEFTADERIRMLEQLTRTLEVVSNCGHMARDAVLDAIAATCLPISCNTVRIGTASDARNFINSMKE